MTQTSSETPQVTARDDYAPTPGFVGEKIGFTVQVKQFEPVKAEVWGQLPCTIDNKEQTYRELHDFLDKALAVIRKEVDEYLQDMRNPGSQ